LKPGQYQVTVTLPNGYVFTRRFQGVDDGKDSNMDPLSGKSDCRTLAAGGVDNTVDAGAYKPASIGDFVWNDLNGDGIQDANEPGIANVIVKLFHCGDDVTSATPLA